MGQRERGTHTGLEAGKWASLGHSKEMTEISLKKKENIDDYHFLNERNKG